MNTRLILLRHGQPERQNCLLGRTDCSLTELGWQQMVKSVLAVRGIDRVITSPLLRCKLFAVDYATKNSIPLDHESAWQEFDFGDWDGISYEKLQREYNEQFSKFIAEPEACSAHNGELLSDFNHRIDGGLKRLLVKYSNKKILVVTHAGVIRNLVAWGLGMNRESNKPYQRFAIDYASISEINIFQDEKLFPQLVSLNQSPKMESY